MTSGAGAMNGFNWAADALGGFHDHFEIELNGANGNDPDMGVYIIGLSIGAVDQSLATTDPFYFVLNLGASEDDHEAAIEWVETNLVPAPGAIALFGLIGAASSRRRRRA